MKILCVMGRYNYGNPARGESHEYSNFVPAFQNLGHETILFESWDRSAYRNFAQLNEALLRTVDELRPDMIFTVIFTYELWLETLELLLNTGTAATVNWATDDSWKYKRFSRLVAPAYHAFTTTYADAYRQYHRDGISNVILTQWATNSKNLRSPLPAAECKYSVSFIGSAHGDRKQWIDDLASRGIEVSCFGHGWPSGPVTAEDIPNLIRNSCISLNFANAPLTWDGLLPQRRNQIKARTFEVPGSGSLLLTQAAPDLERYYTLDQEAVSFGGPDELAAKIRHYLAHPAERDRIAWAGYGRTCAEHTYEHRLSEVIDFTMRMFRQHRECAPNSHQLALDPSAIRSTVAQHKLSRQLSAVRKILVVLCSAVWGTRRGPRAARQIVFEWSWRTLGARTYRASGLPGRMFYEVS
jgi:spore maturation protein CgeB